MSRAAQTPCPREDLAHPERRFQDGSSQSSTSRAGDAAPGGEPQVDDDGAQLASSAGALRTGGHRRHIDDGGLRPARSPRSEGGGLRPAAREWVQLDKVELADLGDQ
jgi:hypothetical protein